MDPVAVAEKVSGKPSGGPMLEGDKLKEFASAIGGQPVDDSTPAPAEDAPPGDPTHEESAPEPTPPPAAAAPKPAAARAPAPQGDEPKGPIPYDRFKEVTDQRNAERAQFESYKAQEVQRIQEAAQASAATTLFKIAEEHPELAPLIFQGKPVQPKAAPVDPNAPQLTPEQKEIAQIRENNAALMSWKQKTEQAAILQGIQDRAEGQMEKHPIFKNDAVRTMSEEIIVKRILTQPHISPEVIVDQVAKGFSDMEASIKAQYVERKQTTARTVVPGVGAGSPPAAPAKTPQKLKLADGSALKALSAALAGAGQS